ncbi:hypothetical protein SS50377_24203 [Spironucleus salmonicida]|uniref:Uncharacterized protein n=1 Tax=Spironucleus salmonicida TaxID=348837 RepID=A0A9P8RYN9_9EUKA|nr:hypothetical protein SS50377_24198 [Spironucleus salmonicida]KAH0574248.1 hypothetical protein SS50377_24199 [Spironucleus salmonicida]KAH0574249.1 hypothetical protein SS50377_24200 [Spironucleus salmonicida]KAH0574250.1 hypothetical protein SS50377_24201 [Spironucleus salmonicida]KAH0574251.1 hypothetical protein SS50377_24202 [Spironucleus salmonicida]
MFRPKNFEKDKTYYRAFQSVMAEYAYNIISPAHAVVMYQNMLKARLVDRSHCFMVKVAKAYNRASQHQISNYGAAQYFYKTFHRHSNNYRGEGTQVHPVAEVLDLCQEVSSFGYQNLFDDFLM